MLSKFRYFLYLKLVSIVSIWYRGVYHMDVGSNVNISRKASLDKSVNPQGIHIGDDTLISGGVIMLAHDFSRNLIIDTYIGKKCFIGCGSIILPGVKIGDEVIVGAGSVVTKDIPSNCIVAGNPARIIKENINLGIHGKIIGKP